MISSLKIRFRILVLPIMAISCSGIFCMNPNQICFYLNSKRKIKSYSAHGDMEFYVEPKEFEGKDIVDVLPLSGTSKKQVRKELDLAAKKNGIVEIQYDIEDEKYIAEVIPVSNRCKRDGYLVTVREK